MSLRTEEHYKPADLKCGDTVYIFGRHCLLFDCDAHTKQWYGQNLGYVQVPIALKKGAPSLQYQAVPGHTGYGTEEDSLGSVIAL